MAGTRVRMGDIWDRTTQVLQGRGGVLGTIAALTIYLPSLVRDAFVAFTPKGTVTFALVGGLLSLAVILIALWGQLAIIAAASDPATDRPAAQRQASARILPALGVSLVLFLAIIVVLLPIVVAVFGAGVDWQAVAQGAKPDIAPGRAAFIGLYGFVLAIAALFVGARLILVNPVVLNERRGVGAIAHSWALTRGMTWRIVGVLLLFTIVLGVAAIAAQAVSGLIFRLILGADAVVLVGFLAGAVAAIVSTVFTVIALAFVAQLYVALVPRQPAVS